MTKKTIYFIIKLSTRGNYAYYLFAEKPEREKRKEIIFMRKIIKALLVVLVLAMALTALAACDLFPIREPEVTEPTPCEHKGGAATCTEAAICEICGESYGEALGHDMSEATCTEAAACKREGCDYTEGKALGHKNGFTASVQPTCTEEGISSSQYCTVCQEVFVEAIVIPAKGHAWVDATCTNPKTCDVCGETEGDPIAHTWTDVEGKAPTCTEPGYTAHKVCTCKATEGKEVLDATGHTYVYGICSVCNAQDPDYVNYYLIGYINGADYGCNNDYLNLGEYKFVDGKLTATFNVDSYVFIKSANLEAENKDWFMTSEYVPGKTATLANTSTGTSEKMFVPGGVEIVFTLTVNEDGTLTLVADYHVHVYSIDVEGKAPTCVEEGYTAHKACECGETTGKEVLSVINHADDDRDFKCDTCSTNMLPAEGEALTIKEALAVAQIAGTNYTTQKYYITGTVKNVYQTTYGNMYIVDEEGNELCIYGLYTWDEEVRYDKMTYKPVAGDEITVYTVLGMYGSTKQGKNAWLDEVVAHEHNYETVVTDPTCIKAGYSTHTCSICGDEIIDTPVDALGHTTDNGTCERCGNVIGGEVSTEPITVSKTMKELITQYGWTNATTKQSFDLDDVVSVKINGGANTGKAYDGDHIRLYATDSPAGTVTITVPEGYELVSVKISTVTGTYAFLYVDGTTTDICNQTVEVSGNSVLLNSVKNGSNGKQVRVTAIEVVYKAIAE